MASPTRTTSPAGMLTLLALRGVGPLAAQRLADRFETLDEIRAAPASVADACVAGAARTTLRDAAAWRLAADHAQQLLDEAHRLEVSVLTTEDADYPEWLLGVSDRPPVLYAKGTLRRGRRFVACIGTREPSRFGEQVTGRVVATLASYGWGIVSGLAIGVDSLAHQAALDNGAYTVAILANGLETVYPKKNSRLADAILAAGGALLSEQPFGAPAIPRNLVQRDRLQSGMSAGTIVMQTDIVGGSMHTVRFTLLQGRLLFAPVPPPAHAEEPKSRGIHALTHLPARDFARKIDAAGEYAAILERSLADRTAATPIANRDDYQKLLAMLETAATGPVAAPRRSSNPQLGLL